MGLLENLLPSFLYLFENKIFIIWSRHLYNRSTVINSRMWEPSGENSKVQAALCVKEIPPLLLIR